MADPLSALGASAAKFAAEVTPAAFGAMVSMRFLPTDLSKMQRFTAALAAYVIGTYFGRGICAYMAIDNPRVVDAVVFGTALFGMSFVGTAMTEIKPLIQAMRKRWVGEADQEPTK